jgi:glutamate--cysteine ligase
VASARRAAADWAGSTRWSRPRYAAAHRHWPRVLTASSLSREAIEREVVDRFTSVPAVDVAPGQVGVELEWMPAITGPQPPRPLRVAETDRLLARDPTLRSDARVTFEPGGQLEISPPPSTSVTDLLRSLATLQSRVERCLEPSGAGLFASGLNPWNSTDELGLQTTHARYVSMQRHFDRIGTYGRRMMRQSMALQVSLDLGQPSVAGWRWRLANLAGPALSAAFANSPVVAGEVVGIPGARSQAWQLLDPTRTGFDGAQVGEPPPVAYRDFALAATYIDLQASTTDRRLERDDVAYHLSTLFPPVRPRRHLEVRFIDALPTRWVATPVIVLAALLYDQSAGSAALELLEDTRLEAAIWRRSCEAGVQDQGLRESAIGLFEIAREAIARFPHGYFPEHAERLLAEFEERYPGSGRCPADEQLEAYRKRPEDLSPWK